MPRKLEEYLINQRDRLDVETPDDTRLWKKIHVELLTRDIARQSRAKMFSIKRILNMVAIAFIVFVMGFITEDIVKSRKTNRLLNLASVNSDLGRREMTYMAMVGFKTEEVSEFKTSDDTVIRELFDEIKKLDLIYDEAMKDLEEIGPNDKIINTIFDTYEQRIRLLELIILETNKSKSYENNEKIIL